jgi:hypothetical protein
MGISYDELFNKSKIFIEKAIYKRDQGDYSEFLLWSSLALELLGKAALAYVHPSLVVDPNDPKGFLVACGYSRLDDFKTITAKTVFERLHNTLSINRFDQKTKDFCMSLANKRNAELHSGLIPFDGVQIETWVPKLWDVYKILLDFQQKTLTDFVGEQEAINAEEIINDHSQTIQKLIELRVERHRQAYKEKYAFHSPQQIVYDLDIDQEIIDCPSCSNDGIADGELSDKEYVGRDPDEPWIELIDETYAVTSFRCLYCDLKLNGYDEIDFSGIDPTFIKRVEDEPDYEPDYGND